MTEQMIQRFISARKNYIAAQFSELNKEQNELNKIINKCNKFLASKKLQNKEFLDRLNKFVEKYGWTRRTEVIDLDLDVEKTILKKHEEKNVENFIIALTKGNTIKRMTLTDANKKQKLLTEEDIIKAAKTAQAHDYITSFSEGLIVNFLAIRNFIGIPCSENIFSCSVIMLSSKPEL